MTAADVTQFPLAAHLDGHGDPDAVGSRFRHEAAAVFVVDEKHDAAGVDLRRCGEKRVDNDPLGRDHRRVLLGRRICGQGHEVTPERVAMVECEGEDLRHSSLTVTRASSSATSSACTTPATGCRTAAADIAAARRSRSGHGWPVRCPWTSAAKAASPAPTGLPRCAGGAASSDISGSTPSRPRAPSETTTPCAPRRAVGGPRGRGGQRNRHREPGRLGQLVLIGLHQGGFCRDRGQQRRSVSIDERVGARVGRKPGKCAVGVDGEPGREAA